MAKNRNPNSMRWMEKIRKGDEQAFELLFEEFYYNLSRFAWRYVNSKAIAEEIVQDVFADLWDQRKSWKPGGSIKSYLYKAVKHRAIDHKRHQEIQDEYDPEWAQKKEVSRIDYEDTRHKAKIQEAIKKEIQALPPRSRMTFKLSRYDGLTYSEIADVMDVSVKTVESQMSRTLKILRSRLSHLLPFFLTALLAM